MSNTAKKYEFENPLVQSLLTDYKAQGVVSNLIMKPVEEILLTRNHWETLAGLTKDDAQKEYYKTLMNELDVLLVIKQKLSMDVYGSHEEAKSILDSLGLTPVNNKTKDAEFKVERTKQAKEIQMIPDLGSKPKQEIVADLCKSLIAEGKVDEATAVATKYYGEANYTPKKEKAKIEKWNEKKIQGWIKTFVEREGLKEKHQKPKAEEQTSNDNERALLRAGVKAEDIKEFGSMCDTLEDETKFLDSFSMMYPKLMAKGSEDKEAAEILVKAFFTNRNYEQENIDKWLAWLLDESKEDIDHWKYLGRPGTKDGILGNAPSYKDIQDAVIEKIQNGVDKETVINSLSSKINGHVILDEKGHNYEMWTILHARDFLSLIYDENINKKEDNSKNVSKEKSAKKDAPTPTDTNTSSKESNKETSKESKQDQSQKQFKKEESPKDVKTAHSESGSKEDKSENANSDTIIPLQEQKLKALILKSIKNGGIVEDVMYIPEVTELVNTGLKSNNSTREFENIKKVEKFIKEFFEEVYDEYDNKRVQFPFGAMMGNIRFSESNDIPIKDFVKDHIDLVQKRNGEFLKLVGKNMEPVEFKSEDDFKVFVKEKYQYFKDERAQKEAEDEATLKERKEKQEEDAKNNKINEVNERLKEIEDKKKTETTVQKAKDAVSDKIDAVLNKGKKKGLTEEEMISEIKELWGQEDANRANVSKKMKVYLKENGSKMSYNDMMNLIMTHKPKEDDEAESVETIEKVSETNKELFDICKEFTTLDELANQITELKEKGEWKDALALSIELIADNNQITEAEGWNEEQVTAWFNNMFNSESQESEEDIEDAKVVDEGEENTYDFGAILTAGNKAKFKKAMQAFVSKHEMNKADRTALGKAILEHAKGSHTKQIAKQGEKVVFDIIHNTIEKHKKATK